MSDCINEMRGKMHPDGHVQVWVDGRYQYAHRLAYAEIHGPIPPGVVIRHTCDNPPCKNGDHLVAGTQTDNMADMWSRGRGVCDLAHETRRKLNDRQLRMLRWLGGNGYTTEALAAGFGVSKRTVWRVLCASST